MEFSRPAMKVLSLGKGTFGLGGDLKSRIMLSVYNQSSNNGTNQQHTLSKDSNDSGQKEKFSSRLKFVQQVPNCINNLQNLQNRTSRFGIPLDTLETLSPMPVYHKVLNYFKNVAITDADGDFIYEDVFRRSCRLAKEIQSLLKNEKFDQKICLVCPNGVSFVVAQWATWMSGNIVVPLSSSHSTDALEYFAKDCKASLVIGTRDTEEKLNELTKQIDIPLCILDKTYTANPVTEFDDTLNVESFDQLFYAERHTALLLYTANSTGPPRGLLYRHYNLNAQADGIVQVWDLDNKSSLLNALPLNQTYGIVSSLLAPMSVGGRVVMMDKFDSVRIWAYLLGVCYNGQKEQFPKTKIDILPSTPAHYYKLYQRYHELFKEPKMKEFVYNRCRKDVRLMMCGSSHLPSGLSEEWRQITGHSILQSFSQPEASGLHASYFRLQNQKGKRRNSLG